MLKLQPVLSDLAQKAARLIPTNQLQQLIRRNLTTHIRTFQQTICQDDKSLQDAFGQYDRRDAQDSGPGC